ncbi:MAG: hypothetical protein QXF23_06565 [Candidatus Bathyarchaeia archaeon]
MFCHREEYTEIYIAMTIGLEIPPQNLFYTQRMRILRNFTSTRLEGDTES